MHLWEQVLMHFKAETPINNISFVGVSCQVWKKLHLVCGLFFKDRSRLLFSFIGLTLFPLLLSSQCADSTGFVIWVLGELEIKFLITDHFYLKRWEAATPFICGAIRNHLDRQVALGLATAEHGFHLPTEDHRLSAAWARGREVLELAAAGHSSISVSLRRWEMVFYCLFCLVFIGVHIWAPK